MKPTERSIELGWKLLEYKFAYYHPEKLHSDWNFLIISDQEYDALEAEYKALGGDPHVDFPSHLPCGELVKSKLSVSKEQARSYAKKKVK